jgi:hypothetical protein
MIFKPGDQYIQFTNRGGINRGVVDRICSVHMIDLVNRVTYEKYTLINTNGITYELDGSDGKFYPIKSELSEESCAKILETTELMQERKRTWNP